MLENLLLNPKRYERMHPDEKTRQVMVKTIEFFENKGLKSIKEDDQDSRWCDDYLKFLKEEQVYATLLTPAGYGDPDSRFDLTRICEYNEIAAFYSLSYQYCYQVSILGLGPIWMGDNEAAKHRTAQLLKEGGIFALGLSEREHGADLYSNSMKLCPMPLEISVPFWPSVAGRTWEAFQKRPSSEIDDEPTPWRLSRPPIPSG